MFLELFLVAGLVMFLNHMGVVNVSSPVGILVTLATIIFSFMAFYLIVKLLTNIVTEQMFGVSKWGGSRAPIVGRDTPPRLPANPTLDLLRKRAHQWPNDLGASRDLADGLARGGFHHLANAERHRFLNSHRKTLEPATIATILYRIADSLLTQGQPEEAARQLQTIIRDFPGSREAELAQIRINNILDNANSRQVVPPVV
jgi:hypothetical protein